MGKLDGEFRKTISIIKKVFALLGISVYTREDNLSHFKRTLRKIHYIVAVGFLSIVISSLGGYVAATEELNFIQTTEALPCAMYCIIGLVKVIALYNKLDQVENLVYELERLFPTEEKDETIVNMVVDYVSQLKLSILILTIINIIFIWGWNLSSLIEMLIEYLRYGTVHRLLPFYAYLPWDYSTQFFPYVGAYIYHVCGGSVACLTAVGPDIFFVAMANHIVLQFKILQIKMNKNIENILPEEYHTSLDMNHNYHDEMYRQLVQYVKIHKKLIEFSHTVEEIFTLTTLINFLCSSVLICCAGFQITLIRGMKAYLFVIFLITGLTQTFYVCRAGETMIEDSNAIGDAVYNSPWYLTDKKYRKMVLFIILRAQRPQMFTALGFSVVCLKSFASIISTSYSYFTLLNTSYKK